MRNDSDLQNKTSNFEFFSSSVCIALLTALGIEAVAVVTLNALAITVFLKERRLRKPSMYLTINLAVADMFNTCSLILWIFSLGNEDHCNIWTINFVSDPIQITGALLFYFPVVSITNLTAISLERMHATFRPFKHRLVKKKMFGAAVAAVWFTAGMFIVILLLRIQFNAILYNAAPEAGAYYLLTSCCVFIIVISYTSIRLKFSCGTHPQYHGAVNRERKLTKTLFIVTVVSLILLLPSTIVYILFHFSLLEIEITSHPPRILYQYSLIFLFFANSFINPVLYAFNIREFKKALLLLLRCRLRSEPVQGFPLNDM